MQNLVAQFGIIITIFLSQTRPDQTRPDQTRPDQTRPDQTRPDQTRPDQTRPKQNSTGLEQEEAQWADTIQKTLKMWAEG